MRPLVDLEVFTARKHLATAREGAREGLLASVHPNVVHQLVLGLERLALAGTLLPKTRVVSLLGSADVLHGDVRHDVVDA